VSWLTLFTAGLAGCVIILLAWAAARLDDQRRFWRAKAERGWLRSYRLQAEINDLRCMLSDAERELGRLPPIATNCDEDEDGEEEDP